MIDPQISKTRTDPQISSSRVERIEEAFKVDVEDQPAQPAAEHCPDNARQQSDKQSATLLAGEDEFRERARDQAEKRKTEKPMRAVLP